MSTFKQMVAVSLMVGALGAAGCGGKQVKYEETDETEVLTADFGSTDVQLMAKNMIDDLNSFPLPQSQTSTDGRLIVLLSMVRNKTTEHIDMRNVMNTIRTGLIRGRKFRFAADKERRQEILSEIEYMESGAVDPAEVKKFGRQVGADVFLSGELTAIDKRSDGNRIIHYKLTLILEDIETAEIIWINEKEIRKSRS